MSGKNICGARTRRCKNKECLYKFSKEEHELWNCPKCGTERRCQRSPVNGEPGRRCRLHGGESPRGFDSPLYEGKGYSKHVPTRLADTWREFLEDEDRLSVESEIALARAMTVEHIKNMQEGVWPLFSQARDLFAKLVIVIDAEEGTDEAASRELLIAELSRIMERGSDEMRAEEEVFKRFESVRKMSETQAKIYEAKGQFVALNKVLGMFGAIISMIRSSVEHLPEGRQILNNVVQVIEPFVGGAEIGVSDTRNVIAANSREKADKSVS